ncbi:unnamed protein product, partial [Mesorhabditis belari]|uniref:G protein-coupled receptor n=1 Tax=Mesorhabditis belari TaxID=2138241 RepID=A0AAF3F2Z6_9BILA
MVNYSVLWTICDFEREIPSDVDQEKYFYWWTWSVNRMCHHFSEYDLLVSFCGVLFGQMIFYLNVLAFVVVKGNDRIGGTVRAFLLCNVTLRSLRGLAEIYFVSCFFGFDGDEVTPTHCLRVIDYPWSGAFVNQIVSTFYMSSQASIQCFEHAITLNRFFAVSFDGRYYRTVSKGRLIQIATILLIPFIFYAAPVATFELIPLDAEADLYTLPGYLYNTNIYGVYERRFGTFVDTFIISNLWILFALCLIAVSVDVFTLRKVHRQMKSSKTDFAQMRTDIRLSAQMMLTHTINVFDWSKIFLTATPSDSSLQQNGSTLAQYFSIVAATGWAEGLLQSLVIIMFNRKLETRERQMTSINTISSKFSSK